MTVPKFKKINIESYKPGKSSIKNSKGFIKLKRTATDATDNCKWDTTPEDGVECAAGGDPPSVQVCGQCGVLYDIAYPVGAKSLI